MPMKITERILEGLKARTVSYGQSFRRRKILIGTDFGATSLIQKNHTIGENVWKIGMITNGGRNRKIWIAERKWRSGRNWVKR